MTLQAQINAVASQGGGWVDIPIGDFSDQPAIILQNHNLLIRGNGIGTILPPVYVTSGLRLYNIWLEFVRVSCEHHPEMPYAIDWRGISHGGGNQISTTENDIGLMLGGETYGNVFTQLNNESRDAGVEIYNGGNHTTFVGGKTNAPNAGVRIIECNGITIIGHNYEGDRVTDQSKSVVQAGYCRGINVINFREESGSTSQLGFSNSVVG